MAPKTRQEGYTLVTNRRNIPRETIGINKGGDYQNKNCFLTLKNLEDEAPVEGKEKSQK